MNTSEHGRRRMSINGSNNLGGVMVSHHIPAHYGSAMHLHPNKGFMFQNSSKNYHHSRSPYPSRSHHNSSSGSSMSSTGSRSSPHSPKMLGVEGLSTPNSFNGNGRRDRNIRRRDDLREVYTPTFPRQGHQNGNGLNINRRQRSESNSCENEHELMPHTLGPLSNKGYIVKSSTRKSVDRVSHHDSGGSCSSGGLLDASLDWNYSGFESENGRSVSLSSDHLPPKVLRDAIFHQGDKVPFSPPPQISASSNCLPSVINNSGTSGGKGNSMIQCDMSVPPPSSPMTSTLFHRGISTTKSSIHKGAKGSFNKSKMGIERLNGKSPKPLSNMPSNQRFSTSEIRDVSTPLPIEYPEHKNIQFNFSDTTVQQKMKKSSPQHLTISSSITNVVNSSDSVFN